MLFFLVKMEKRSRIQFFLWLILVGVEILPSGTTAQGLQCYQCADVDKIIGAPYDGGCKENKKMVPCDTYCVKWIDKEGKGDVVARYCDLNPKGWGMCVLKMFRTCYINNPENRGKISQCLDKTLAREGDQSDPEPPKLTSVAQVCFCKGDLCNGEDKKGGTSGSGGGFGPGPDDVGTSTTTAASTSPKSAGVRLRALNLNLLVIGITQVALVGVHTTVSR